MKACVNVWGLLIPGILLASPAMAQNQDPTINKNRQIGIQRTLDSKYPGVNYEDIDWKRNDIGYYEGTFDYDNRNITASFDSDGNWMESSEVIDLEDLPGDIRNSLSPDEIDRVSRVNNYKNETYYDVTISGEAKPVRFKADGTRVED